MDINGGRKIFLSHKGSDKDTVIDFRVRWTPSSGQR